jgi:putative hydrolases of HD superfamily
MTIDSLLPFIREIDLLKTIERQTLIHNGGRRENSAEHSWHLAMAVLVFQSFASGDLDINKAVKMALLHDIVESYAGDVCVYSDLSQKNANELAALDRLMMLLPESLSAEFKSIWLDFEEGISAEAKYVAALDRFLPLYSNYLNEGHSWKNHNVSSERVTSVNQPRISRGLPELWEVASKMIDESVASGIL